MGAELFLKHLMGQYSSVADCGLYKSADKGKSWKHVVKEGWVARIWWNQKVFSSGQVQMVSCVRPTMVNIGNG